MVRNSHHMPSSILSLHLFLRDNGQMILVADRLLCCPVSLVPADIAPLAVSQNGHSHCEKHTIELDINRLMISIAMDISFGESVEWQDSHRLLIVSLGTMSSVCVGASHGRDSVWQIG